MMVDGTTERGFSIYEFTDRYGQKCSVQKSSLATEDCVWVGATDPGPSLHETGRMHLTRTSARELSELLSYFHMTGELPTRASATKIVIGYWRALAPEAVRGDFAAALSANLERLERLPYVMDETSRPIAEACRACDAKLLFPGGIMPEYLGDHSMLVEHNIVSVSMFGGPRQILYPEKT